MNWNYERQAFFKSVPCEPVDMRGDGSLIVNRALHGIKEGEDLITGTVTANTLRGAKAKATRESGLSGAGGKWDWTIHPRKKIKCYVKDNGFNQLFLWESDEKK